MQDEERKLRRVWFILDEVALLQKLPKLHDAVTRNRKTNNPIVLGFQGRSQLQKHYGLDAEVMFSQPGTKIFLRTSEPDSAKWISETIGEVEIEQVRESRTREQSPRYRHSRSDQLERRIEPLVLPSQIMGLEDRRGYVKLGNAVVQLSFPYVKVPKTQPAIIERLTEALPSEQPKAAGAAAGRPVRDAFSSRDSCLRFQSRSVQDKPALIITRNSATRRRITTAKATGYAASGMEIWARSGDCRTRFVKSTSTGSAKANTRLLANS